jgi:hydrogenase maturation protease
MAVLSVIKPILVFGYGNLSRGDDALGILLLQQLQQNPALLEKIEFLEDFQLQIEHALDLEQRELVLFLDASVNCTKAFDFVQLHAAKDDSYTTHAMSPAAVLSVYRDIKKAAPPACFLLSIQGISFELGEPLSESAQSNLQLAAHKAAQLLLHCELRFWLAATQK